jgi:hypothetical protein
MAGIPADSRLVCVALIAAGHAARLLRHAEHKIDINSAVALRSAAHPSTKIFGMVRCSFDVRADDGAR